VVLVPGAYNAQRTSMDLPISQFVLNTVQSVSHDPIVVWPSAGGSLPLVILEENVGSPLISVPLANHDNNQHAENENLRLQNFWDGIETIAALMTAN
jgi:acetylornithine deacetylase/succinyl-diaminopimelate desuccinylase-like protein